MLETIAIILVILWLVRVFVHHGRPDPHSAGHRDRGDPGARDPGAKTLNLTQPLTRHYPSMKKPAP